MKLGTFTVFFSYLEDCAALNLAGFQSLGLALLLNSSAAISDARNGDQRNP